MTHQGRTFIDRCLAGDVPDPSAQIHDEIDVWHAGGTGLSLHEFLGMTWPEYQLWAEKPWTLSPILAVRKTKLSF